MRDVDTSQVIEDFPVRQHQNLSIGFFSGVLVSILTWFTWSRIALNAAQRHLVAKYVGSSFLAGWLPGLGKGPSKAQIICDMLRYGVIRGSVLDAWRLHYHLQALPGCFNQDALAMVIWPLCISLAALFTGLIWGMTRDGSYMRALRRGIRKRGPVLMTPAEYNRGVKDLGISILLDKPTWKEK